ncbi:MAG: hypothetical protein V4455_07325 [Pseudomonadota bacterium]
MLARTMTRSLKHSVLVTHPMSEGAMTRLQTFFDVETRVGEYVPSGDELVDWLYGKAGVIADTRFVFDAKLVGRLPMLKAICNLDAEHHNLDLQALTSAGIRATSTPAAGSGQLSVEASADKAWQQLLPLLQRAVPSAGTDGRYSSKWSRRVLLQEPAHTLQELRMGILGTGPLANALAARAQAAKVQLLDLGRDCGAFWRTADVLVCAGGANASPGCITATGMALMKPAARILNLAGPQALAADVLRNTALFGRIENGDVAPVHETTAPGQLLLNQTHVAAEDLIASLGFGRNSWHPPHLLNPDILCDSCC